MVSNLTAHCCQNGLFVSNSSFQSLILCSNWWVFSFSIVLDGWVNSVAQQKDNQAEKYVAFCCISSISHLFQLVKSGGSSKHQGTKEELGLHGWEGGWGRLLQASARRSEITWSCAFPLTFQATLPVRKHYGMALTEILGKFSEMQLRIMVGWWYLRNLPRCWIQQTSISAS